MDEIIAASMQNTDAGQFPATPVMGVQTSGIPIVFVDGAGHDQTVMMANASFVRLSGLNESKVLQKPLAAALTKITVPANIAFIGEILALNQPGTLEIECRRANGAPYLMSVFHYPLRGSVDAPVQHILTFHKPNVQAVPYTPSTQETRMLYKHAPGFIATTEGAEHLLTFANDSFRQFTGYYRLEGLTVAEAMPEVVDQGFIALLDGVFNTGIPFIGKAVAFDLPDGKTGKTVRRYGDFVYEPVRDAEGKIIGLFCEGFDVTGQVEAEAAVMALKTKVAHTSRVNAMGTMAATMAHELNQPLSAIVNYSTGCLRLLGKPNADMDDIKEAMLAVQDAGNRAGAIIRTLRDLTDRRARTYAPFELKPVIQEALNLTRNACSAEIQLRTDIPNGLTLVGDRVQIQQVIINLVRNGCDAVADLEQQHVSVSATPLPDEVVVCVRDTGRGLSAGAAEEIFTWSDSNKEGGMGLGLSISRTIVETHGGRIWLEDSSSKGTEFRFSLPRKPNALV